MLWIGTETLHFSSGQFTCCQLQFCNQSKVISEVLTSVSKHRLLNVPRIREFRIPLPRRFSAIGLADSIINDCRVFGVKLINFLNWTSLLPSGQKV